MLGYLLCLLRVRLPSGHMSGAPDLPSSHKALCVAVVCFCAFLPPPFGRRMHTQPFRAFYRQCMSGGKPKPHLAQFLEILAKLRSIKGSESVRASQVMVVGDNLIKDIGGARQAGMKRAWLRVNGDFDDDADTSAGALRVTTLDPALLDTVASSL